MQIRRLRFKNLNSLTGEWLVDLTAPAIASNGIFAITGPTGAGKTTILDALCLGLYGRTPRLGKLTKTTNEIMSRHSGDCFAEVEFQTDEGLFRSCWSQHRARKKARGELQQPRHELADASSGKLMESKLRAVEEGVERLTGMDFERFTRSSLLAQGGFAAFLEAKADERAPLLEQITGTDIYSRISIKAHERRVAEARKLETLQAELDGLQVLTEEQRTELRRRAVDHGIRAAGLSFELKTAGEALHWSERLEQLEQEWRQLERSGRDLEADKLDAQPRLRQLAGAQRAVALEGDWAAVDALRRSVTQLRTQQAAIQQRLPVLVKQTDEAQQAWAAKEKELQGARRLLERERVATKEVRALDSRLVEAREQHQGAQRTLNRGAAQLASLRKELEGLAPRQEEAARGYRQAEEFLAKHADDESLGARLAAIVELGRQWQMLHRRAATKTAAKKAATDRLEKARVSFAGSQRQAAAAVEAHRAGQQKAAALGRDLGELLGQRELSRWRHDVEQLAVRQRLLVELGQRRTEAMASLAKARHDEELAAKIDSHLGRLDEQRRGGEGEEKVHRALVTELEGKVLFACRVRDLEQERTLLRHGQPCPLCGATEHPFREGVTAMEAELPQPDQAQRQLEQARATLQEVVTHIARLHEQRAAAVKEQNLYRHQAKEAHSAAAQQQEAWHRLADRLALPAAKDVEAGPRAVDEEIRRCDKELQRMRHTVQQADELETAWRKAQEQVVRLAEGERRLERTLEQARHEVTSAEAEEKRLTQESSEAAAEVSDKTAELNQSVGVYGCAPPTEQTWDQTLAGLEERHRHFGERRKQREAFLEQGKQLAAQAQTLTARVEQGEDALGQQRTVLNELKGRLEALRQERHRLYGTKDPDEEEERRAKALTAAETGLERARQEHQRLLAELTGEQQTSQGLARTMGQTQEELREGERILVLRLAEAGFDDEAAFLAARLLPEAYEELLRLDEELRRREVALTARRRDKQAERRKEVQRRLTAKSSADLRQIQQQVTTQLTALRQEQGGIRARLEADEQEIVRRKSHVRARDAQRGELSRWEQLHELIGSADGKKFRNFAQGLTFELMVSQANQQLQRLTDRYGLVRDPLQPLELNVVDHYLAGEVRSTKNLSGGESFLVSLALALGLSHMASRNVRVDSLFLDEGFGTLDEDALETALQTLGSLQQEGKLIGIISHVSALKDSIATHITVEAGAGGRSRLVGPGCLLLS
jgi:exonuclease SbcC